MISVKNSFIKSSVKYPEGFESKTNQGSTTQQVAQKHFAQEKSKSFFDRFKSRKTSAIETPKNRPSFLIRVFGPNSSQPKTGLSSNFLSPTATGRSTATASSASSDQSASAGLKEVASDSTMRYETTPPPSNRERFEDYLSSARSINGAIVDAFKSNDKGLIEGALEYFSEHKIAASALNEILADELIAESKGGLDSLVGLAFFEYHEKFQCPMIVPVIRAFIKLYKTKEVSEAYIERCFGSMRDVWIEKDDNEATRQELREGIALLKRSGLHSKFLEEWNNSAIKPSDKAPSVHKVRSRSVRDIKIRDWNDANEVTSPVQKVQEGMQALRTMDMGRLNAPNPPLNILKVNRSLRFPASEEVTEV